MFEFEWSHLYEPSVLISLPPVHDVQLSNSYVPQLSTRKSWLIEIHTFLEGWGTSTDPKYEQLTFLNINLRKMDGRDFFYYINLLYMEISIAETILFGFFFFT